MTRSGLFEGLVATAPVIMTGGSTYERFRRRTDVVSDPDIAHAALVYDDAGASLLASATKEYIDVAQTAGLPMLVGTPTWRASHGRVERSAFRGRRVNQDCVAFSRSIVDEYRTDDGSPIVIGGSLGPAGDAYRPDEGLGIAEAERLHSVQAEALAEGGVDLLMSMTHPAIDEARGMARALEATALPYVISFVVREAGTLLDGTPLDEAMDRIDQETRRAPVGYFINCVHPAILEGALTRSAPLATKRLLGFRANTAAKSPEELDRAEELITGTPEVLAGELATLHQTRGLKILGGCCGTGTEHMEALAESLRSP